MRYAALLALLFTAAPAQALEPLKANGLAFSVPLVAERVSAQDALSRLATAKARQVNALVLSLDDLPASATLGLPSEEGFKALDQVLDQAGKAGVYVLPALVDLGPNGAALRLAQSLGGKHASLYFSDGRALDAQDLLLKQVLDRVNSVNGLAYKDDPSLGAWFLGLGLDDPDDRRAKGALSWALRTAAAIKAAQPGKLVGLQAAEGLPLDLGAAADLDFFALPRALSKAARSALARPLLLVDAQGPWTSAAADPKPLRMGAAVIKPTDAHEASVGLRLSERAVVRVDYGSGGLLRSSASSAPGAVARLKLRGLKSGERYQLRISAQTADGRAAAHSLQALDMPAEAALPAQAMAYSGNIITARGAKFWDGDKPFRYMGSNNYYIRYQQDPQVMLTVLDAAKDLGMKVLRCQANGERFEPMEVGLYQPLRHLVAGGPGNFQEEGFKEYDRLMAEAAKRGIRIILYITDNWEYFGGMRTWARWRGHDDKNKFYTDEKVKADYKDLIKFWATRKNTVNGVYYKDDPALFAWELANEPRNEADPSGKTLAAWVDEMAGYWKGLDPRHMVSAGLEGLRATGGSHWSGSDFIGSQSSPHIDFACFHLYPVSEWRRYSLKAAKQAVKDYVKDAHEVLKKPVVMEEYGIVKKYDGELNRFEWVTGLAETFFKAGGDGINHWMLIHNEYDGGDGNEIQPSDTDYVNAFKKLAQMVEQNP